MDPKDIIERIDLACDKLVLLSTKISLNEQIIEVVEMLRDLREDMIMFLTLKYSVKKYPGPTVTER